MTGQEVATALLGRIRPEDLPFWKMFADPTRDNVINGIIATGAAGAVVLGALAVVAVLTWTRRWGWLWREWLTATDHKRIGIMYVVLSLVMLSRALIEAVIMRTQQAFGLSGGFLSADHFGQLFSTHGSIMIFFMAMPFLTGLINYVVPLQIGARDVAYPTLNSVGLGLTAAGAAIVMVSLCIGEFSTAGWSGYPPYTEVAFNPGVGPDYWIWAVTLASLGSTTTGINVAVTIYKKRCPGMRYMRMPLFCWTSLCVSILMIFAMPALTVATGLLALDRYAGFHFFTNDAGGNMMNYPNLFWLFGHPEVYILILPAFGVWSEVFSTFSGKRLYGYTSLVIATMCIAVLSFTVWVHHFFTMGQGANVNAAFGIATMLIGIPTGVKVYDWILTMYRGRVRLSVPLIYGLGFLVLFVIGGASGIVLANPTLDYQVHNSVFLVAHFHNMVIPGVLFGMLAGTHYWFPKAFGFRLDEVWGRVSALSWIFGFVLAFFPLYALGLMGLPRRSVAYSEAIYQPLTWVALAGAALLFLALAALVIQLVVSVRRRGETRVLAGDPWDGRTLEWSVSAPPPEWNFATIPVVSTRDAFMQAKLDGTAHARPAAYTDIELPKNTALGMVTAVTGGAVAFALVWHIWWLVALGCAAALLAVVGRGLQRDLTRTIPADAVRQAHERWLDVVAGTRRSTRGEEESVSNRGLPLHGPEGVPA